MGKKKAVSMTELYDQRDLEEEIVAADAGMESNISMSSEDEDIDELHVHKVHAELVQIDKLKGIARKYSLVNVYYLLVREQSKFSKRKYWVHLGYLQKKPRRNLIIAWRWLITAVGFGGITAGAYLLLPQFDFPYKDYAQIGILLACSALSMLSLMTFFYQSRYRQVYYSKNGRAPFVELMPGKPRRKKYKEFITLLAAHQQRAYKDLDPNKALARELREHRRLRDAGIISEKAYKRAKGVVFKGHSQTNVKKK